MATHDEEGPCPQPPVTSVANPPGGKDKEMGSPRDALTVPNALDQAPRGAPGPRTTFPTGNSPDAAVAAPTRIPSTRPAPTRHHGWSRYSMPMAKCDMCEHAGRGVMHKCDVCAFSICRECCEGGKLRATARHELDPASVSWEASPKEPRPSAASRGSAERGGGRGVRGRGRGRGRGGGRYAQPLSTPGVTYQGQSPAYQSSGEAPVSPRSSELTTSSQLDQAVEYSPNRADVATTADVASAANVAAATLTLMPSPGRTQEGYQHGPDIPATQPPGPDRHRQFFHQGHALQPSRPFRDQNERRTADYSPYEGSRQRRSSDFPYPSPRVPPTSAISVGAMPANRETLGTRVPGTHGAQGAENPRATGWSLPSIREVVGGVPQAPSSASAVLGKGSLIEPMHQRTGALHPGPQYPGLQPSGHQHLGPQYPGAQHQGPQHVREQHRAS